MGSIDNGTQVFTYSYKQEGLSKTFNSLNYKLHSRGIYSGGTFARVSDIQITLSPTLLFFEDTANTVGVRIETTTNANIAVQASTPYIVGRFHWINTENNYMDFLAVAYGDITATDIIFGRLVFNGSVLTTEYDYSKKQWSSDYYTSANDFLPQFKVEAQEPYSTTVVVKPGRVFFDSAIVTLATNTTSPVFSFPVSANGRTDLITLNRSSVITIIQGADTSGAPIPTLNSDYLLLAIIRFPAGATQVKGSYIEYVPLNKYLDGGSSSKAIYGQTSYGTTMVTDANAIAKSGFYTLNPPYTNGPTAATYHIVHTQSYVDNLHAFQIATLFGSSTSAYIRTRSSGSWNTWQKVWNAGNDGTGSGLDADTIDGIDTTNIVYGDSSYASISYSGDLNSIIKSGFYRVDSSATNKPLNLAGHMIHIQSTVSNNYATQIWSDQGGVSSFIRTNVNGTWTSWGAFWAGTTVRATINNSSIDWNNILKSGVYTSGNSSNSPISGTVTILHIQSATNDSFATQMATGVVDQVGETTYVRHKNNDVWTAWSKLWNASNDGLGSGLETDLVPTGTPATAGATGTVGSIRYDASYVYICTATNTWKRASIVTW
jgi:hypothetical protein